MLPVFAAMCHTVCSMSSLAKKLHLLTPLLLVPPLSFAIVSEIPLFCPAVLSFEVQFIL
jgi:hypothetical protein